jgi:hypothetical protein
MYSDAKKIIDAWLYVKMLQKSKRMSFPLPESVGSTAKGCKEVLGKSKNTIILPVNPIF